MTIYASGKAQEITGTINGNTMPCLLVGKKMDGIMLFYLFYKNTDCS